jgi:Zn-dependent protease with chaperone function
MTARWQQTAILCAALACVALACASRVALPEDVSDAERRAVEARLADVTLEELERGANRRYWELFLTDAAVVARLPAEQREALRGGSPHEIAALLDERALRSTGFVPLAIVRANDGPLRAAPTQRGAAGTTDLSEAASDPGVLRRVIARRVQFVGHRVAVAAGRPGLHVIAEPALGANAGAPLGAFGTDRVYVGSEFVLLSGSDDELACAIGHEVAHVTEGHTTSGAWAELGKGAIGIFAALGLAVLLEAGTRDGSVTGDASSAAEGLGVLARVLAADLPLLATGWERRQEREADAVGLLYAQRAGFDPDACARLMLRMAYHEHAHGAELGPRWWRTHPATAERVVTLRKLAAQARAGALELRE